jgi:hypothetical protein
MEGNDVRIVFIECCHRKEYLYCNIVIKLHVLIFRNYFVFNVIVFININM